MFLSLPVDVSSSPASPLRTLAHRADNGVFVYKGPQDVERVRDQESRPLQSSFENVLCESLAFLA